MTNWEGILRDHGPAVWRTLWRLLGNRADAEECFQETFLAAVRAERRPAPVVHWGALLQTLATARAIDRLRRRYCLRRESAAMPAEQEDVFTPEDTASRQPSASDLLDAKELSQRLRAALALMPERQAEVFALHALSGWSYQEIGQSTGMSSSAVGVTIHRARQRLREILGEPAEPERAIQPGGAP
jgi:RNA polymerase sigma-70 factor (ECF subfamily)